VVIALDRFDSALAIGLVLFADLIPAMLLGPVFGAAADRWSRRTCLVVADILRAWAFLGIALVDGFVPTVLLAGVAGIGTALLTPAGLSALPSLVAEKRQAAATALYGAITDLGFIAGPALAGAVFVFAGPETILYANAVSFAISAFVLVWLRFGETPAPEEDEERSGLIKEAIDGLAAVRHMIGVREVIGGSAAVLFFGGLFNVAELPFVKDDLDGGETGFAVLNALYGIGFVGGSLSGGKGGAPPQLKRWWLIGLAVIGVGLIACGAAPGLLVATLAFSLAGVGNGLMLVYERLLIQTTVPDRLMGRVFGIKDALTSWPFAIAFLGGGVMVELLGPRAVIIVAGAGGVVVWIGARIALRGVWEDEGEGPDEAGAPLRGRTFSRAVGEDGADAVGGGDGGSALLDHTH
jgi:MFS family permease